jgi:hypothetical protein
MSLYTADKRHYTADISARLYSPSPYYAAKSLAVLPFVVANVLVRLFRLRSALGCCLNIMVGHIVLHSYTPHQGHSIGHV